MIGFTFMERLLMCEFNRIFSHFRFTATNGLDLVALSMILYVWCESDRFLRAL